MGDGVLVGGVHSEGNVADGLEVDITEACDYLRSREIAAAGAVYVCVENFLDLGGVVGVLFLDEGRGCDGFLEELCVCGLLTTILSVTPTRLRSDIRLLAMTCESTDPAPALWPQSVTFDGSPPNMRMYCYRQVQNAIAREAVNQPYLLYPL